MRRSALVKIAVGLVAVSVLAVLFVRSAQSAREAPYIVERASVASWTISLEPAGNGLGAWLGLRPAAPLAGIGNQIFQRGGETVYYPTPVSMPLVLRSEFDSALAGRLTADEVLSIGRAAGLESAMFEPQCMAYRRVSAPGSTRGVYFILFDAPAFDRFRQDLAETIRRTGSAAFDPQALSPLLLVAGLDGNFSGWLPLRADAEDDCLAPIEMQ